MAPLHVAWYNYDNLNHIELIFLISKTTQRTWEHYKSPRYYPDSKFCQIHPIYQCIIKEIKLLDIRDHDPLCEAIIASSVSTSTPLSLY